MDSSTARLQQQTEQKKCPSALVYGTLVSLAIAGATFTWQQTAGAAAPVALDARGVPTAAALDAFGARAGATAAAAAETTEECLESDSVRVYKYTITSSKAAEDGMWADRMFGCSFRNVTDTDGCAKLGKTSCFPDSLAYGLHFVENKVTKSGDKDIAYWDEYQRTINSESFATDTFNQFMHYSLTFYAPDISRTVATLIENEIPYLARKGESPLDGHTYFTIIIQSPSGKVFEITSTVLDDSVLAQKDILTWKHANECPECHFSSRYKRDELNAWYSNFTGDHLRTTELDLPTLLPIRNNIAVSSIATAKKWFTENVPSLPLEAAAFRATDKTSSCTTLTTSIAAYTEKRFALEVRLVENAASSLKLEHTVSDFVAYVERVNARWTGADYGWTAWYDRHLGLLFEDCPLDTYMNRFVATNTSFHPHGMPGETAVTGSAKDHCWTEGVEGYGFEMQGTFDYTYKEVYDSFDWCTWDTATSS